MIRYTWRVRAKCDCGYLWTTGVNQSVICKCGISKIENDTIVIGSIVTDEEDFKLAVANDYNKNPSEIIVELE